jgi:hypothetical protein
MSLTRLQVVLVSAWLTLMVLTLGASLAVGYELTATLYICAIGCLPPLVLWAVFRGAPPPSIGQVIYETEQAPGDMMRRLDAIRVAEHRDEHRS